MHQNSSQPPSSVSTPRGPLGSTSYQAGHTSLPVDLRCDHCFAGAQMTPGVHSASVAFASPARSLNSVVKSGSFLRQQPCWASRHAPFTVITIRSSMTGWHTNIVERSSTSYPVLCGPQVLPPHLSTAATKAWSRVPSPPTSIVMVLLASTLSTSSLKRT